MRVSTSQLQQLAIFTTVFTGGGIGTMYYLQQKTFTQSDYHRLALLKLEECPIAMESLGAPPLRVYNIHLTDRYNCIDPQRAQIKIPVTGSKTGGYLYTSSIRDPDTNSPARLPVCYPVDKYRYGRYKQSKIFYRDI
uniref:Cytochrome C oxidase assembly factor 1 n=1 Tax=Sparus aurata TaxID=8175 RepID=A0A671UCN0_SPAAU